LKKAIPAACSLLEALRLLVPGASNRTLRQMLSHGRVRLNGEVCKIPGRRAEPGDLLKVSEHGSPAKKIHGIEILYDDDDLLVIHKPAGLLTVATLHERERTAYAYLRGYLKRSDARQKIFIVHRLDKFVSGLLVFAKSEGIKASLQTQFQKHSIVRKYWAIVKGRVEKDQGTIQSHLAEDHSRRMHSTDTVSEGKRAVTHYRVLRRFSNLTSLEVTLETGRKNQIRAHMSELGHPVIGDKAYGSSIDPIGRMGLHAFCLGFIHPRTQSQRTFQTAPPHEFRRYLR